MYPLFSLLPPFFPNSTKLKKHLWHKCIKVLSIIIFLSSIYSALYLLLQIVLPITFLSNSIFLIPLLIPFAPLFFILYRESSPAPSIIFSSNINTTTIGLIILAIYCIIFSLLPSLVYRIGLDSIFLKGWRSKVKSLRKK